MNSVLYTNPISAKLTRKRKEEKANYERKKMKKTNFVLFICACGRSWRVGKCIQLAKKFRLEDLQMDGRIILKRS